MVVESNILSNEEKLLLLLASPVIDKEKIYEIISISNWDNIIEKAKRYKVIPIVYYNLKKLNIKVEDSNLEKEYKRNIAKNILLLEELTRILDILNKHNIEVIVFKGADLINSIYPSIGTRYLSDLDILIRKKDLKKIDKLLKSMNYKFYFTNRATHNIYKKEVAVEVHWELINKWIPPEKYAFQLNLDNMWQNKKLKNYNNTNFYTLSEEDYLLYLCCHIIKEYYSDIKWLADIAGFVKYYELNWNNIIKKAHAQKMKNTIYLLLFLLKHLFDIDILNIPKEFENNKLKNFILQNIFKPNLIYKKRLFMYLSIIESNYDKIKAVFGLIPYIFKRIIYY